MTSRIDSLSSSVIFFAVGIQVICWNCQKAIPETAERCPHCESEVEVEPTEDEEALVQNALSGMAPDVVRELRDAFEKSAAGEELVNRIMIGDCPTCGRFDTGDGLLSSRKTDGLTPNVRQSETLALGRCTFGLGTAKYVSRRDDSMTKPFC